jgi:niacin transporter
MTETAPAHTDVRPTTLPGLSVRAVTAEIALVAAAAAVLPSLAHTLGWPVRSFLPMHWSVILAGLVFGWRAGAAVGVLAPLTSFLLSGMPLPHILPAMTVELGAYGCLAGFARQTLRWNPFASAALALVGGRVVFFVTALITGAALPTPMAYLTAAMLPGLAAAAAQLVVLPLIALSWVRTQGGSSTKA